MTLMSRLPLSLTWMTLLGHGPVAAQDPNLILMAPHGTITVDAGGTGSATGTVRFDNIGMSLVDAWAIGVCHDGSVVELTGFVPTAFIMTVNGGYYPGFYGTSIWNPLLGGSHHVVIDLFGVNKLPPGTGYEFVEATYTNLPGTEGLSADVWYCNTIGNPPVYTVIVIAGATLVPTQVNGSIDVVLNESDFVRGNCNALGTTVNLADVVYLLGFLFVSGGTTPNQLPCRDACDANDDGSLNLADAVALLNSLFGIPPASLPAPNVVVGCGSDPTPADPLDCLSYPGCP